MEFTYDTVMAFMERYFKDYSELAQDPATSHRMNDYFTPDYDFTPYIAGNARITGRDAFLGLMASHPSSRESLTPRDIMIDMRRRVVVVLLEAELADSATGEVLVRKCYHVFYQLVDGDSGDVRIKKVLFFEEILPPGTLDMGDVFRKDPAIAKLFTDK